MAELLHALLLDIPEVLETERLVLRAAHTGQGAALHEAMVESFAQLRPWMPRAKVMQTPEQSEAYARESQAKWLARETLDFGWYARGDGRLVGRGGLHSIDWTLPRFEIGYWVRTPLAGQGYATEAAIALTEFARDRLGARRVIITSDTRNAASRRVAEKSGFVLEGILRQSRRDNDGNLADSCMYARVF